MCSKSSALYIYMAKILTASFKRSPFVYGNMSKTNKVIEYSICFSKQKIMPKKRKKQLKC